jgi:hypothetical protein
VRLAGPLVEVMREAFIPPDFAQLHGTAMRLVA